MTALGILCSIALGITCTAFKKECAEDIDRVSSVLMGILHVLAMGTGIYLLISTLLGGIA